MAHPEYALIVWFKDRIYFTSNGKWLHPLFDLEEHLKQHPIDPTQAKLSDKIIGKAAAIIIIRMGFKVVHAGILSKMGLAVLKSHHIKTTYDTLVPRIECKTETLLESIDDIEEAYRIVRSRIS